MRLLLAIFWLLAPATATAAQDNDALARHRSKGVALYEGVAPSGPLEQRFGAAATEFEQAWKLSRNPQDRFNYGLALLRDNAKARAKPELEATARARPDDPAPLYALAVLAMGQNDWQGALTRLDAVIQIAPGDPAARFQRGWVLHDKLDRTEDAKLEFEEVLKIGWTEGGLQFVQALYIHVQILRFISIKTRDPEIGAQVRREMDLYQRYSEFLGVDKPSEKQLREGPLLRPKIVRSKARSPRGAALRRVVRDRTKASKLGARSTPTEGRARVAACDLLGDARPELLEFGAGPLRLWAPGKRGRYADATARAALGVLADASVHAVACADYDNDGDQDLYVATQGADRLMANEGGRFADVTAKAGLGSAVPSRDAVWFDVDADGDLDLYVATGETNLLWENGGARFTPTGGVAGLTDGVADSRAVVVFDQDGDNDLDVLVANATPWTFLLSSLREGRFEEVSRRLGLADEAHQATGAQAEDLNADGRMDLLLETSTGTALFTNTTEGFRPMVLPPGPPRAVPADLGGTGRFDLIRHDGATAELWTATRPGRWAQGPALPAPGGPIHDFVAADVDRDGDVDVVVATPGGLRLWGNDTAGPCRWVRVALDGERNNAHGTGASLELKAGEVYAKRIATGADTLLSFGAGGPPDALRVTWPNGILQNVVAPPACATVTVKEAKAQGGSCPFLYAWNGERMGFVADVLGAAPLGIPMGPDSYLPQDPTELTLVQRHQLRPDDRGLLRLVVTEELREEVTYLDEAALEAVDHPTGTRVVPNERYAFPPGPEDRLFAWPISAQRPFRRIGDTFGNDVTEALSKVDGRRVQGWIKAPDHVRGLVEEHAYVFDPGDLRGASDVWLIAHGWVFWGGGATARSSMQDPRYAFGPVRLDIRDEQGRWRPAMADIGFPAGKSRHMPVDLSNAWGDAAARSTRRDFSFRIVTNVRLTWDAFELVVDPGPVDVRRTRLAPVRAELSWLGFPERVEGGAAMSERFDYHRLRPADNAPWNQAPGMMTRYGDVRPLLSEVDDRFAIFGAGDQLELDFQAAALPALAPGDTRDWLVRLDGYNKDGDFNNGWAQQVEPLPFHGMSGYPYPAHERYPDDDARRRYRAEWNTRPGRTLVAPLFQ